MLDSIHGKITNYARSNFGQFSGTVEVFASGNAFEIVHHRGMHVHSAWFDAANLGEAAHDQEALKGYLSSVLQSVANERNK